MEICLDLSLLELREIWKYNQAKVTQLQIWKYSPF